MHEKFKAEMNLNVSIITIIVNVRNFLDDNWLLRKGEKDLL